MTLSKGGGSLHAGNMLTELTSPQVDACCSPMRNARSVFKEHLDRVCPHTASGGLALAFTKELDSRTQKRLIHLCLSVPRAHLPAKMTREVLRIVILRMTCVFTIDSAGRCGSRQRIPPTKSQQKRHHGNGDFEVWTRAAPKGLGTCQRACYTQQA